MRKSDNLAVQLLNRMQKKIKKSHFQFLADFRAYITYIQPFTADPQLFFTVYFSHTVMVIDTLHVVLM